MHILRKYTAENGIFKCNWERNVNCIKTRYKNLICTDKINRIVMLYLILVSKKRREGGTSYVAFIVLKRRILSYRTLIHKMTQFRKCEFEVRERQVVKTCLKKKTSQLRRFYHFSYLAQYHFL